MNNIDQTTLLTSKRLREMFGVSKNYPVPTDLMRKAIYLPGMSRPRFKLIDVERFIDSCSAEKEAAKVLSEMKIREERKMMNERINRIIDREIIQNKLSHEGKNTFADSNRHMKESKIVDRLKEVK